MPTDGQKVREQFGKWIDEKQYGLGWQDGRGTWEEFLSATWAGYKAGQLARDAEVQALGGLLAARDAEVQALREALSYALHVLECLKAESHNPMLPNARWKSVDMARAALAGEEASQ